MDLNPKTTNDSEEIVDIEEYTKAGKPVPKAKKYKIKIDKELFTVEQSEMSGMEILLLAKKTPPERFQLNQKFKGGQMKVISLEQIVDFTEPGVEKFTTIKLDQNEG